VHPVLSSKINLKAIILIKFKSNNQQIATVIKKSGFLRFLSHAYPL